MINSEENLIHLMLTNNKEGQELRSIGLRLIVKMYLDSKCKKMMMTSIHDCLFNLLDSDGDIYIYHKENI